MVPTDTAGRQTGSFQTPVYNQSLKAVGLEDHPRTQELESEYYTLFQELTKWGKRINLTGRLDETLFCQDHLADSLATHALIPDGAQVVDLGTGAGFPGFPLALFNRQARFTLLDRTQKKISFIKHMAGLLSLTSLEARWLDWTAWDGPPAEVLLCRAVYSDTEFLKDLSSSALWGETSRLCWWRATPSVEELPAGFKVLERHWYRLPTREWRVIEVLGKP